MGGVDAFLSSSWTQAISVLPQPFPASYSCAAREEPVEREDVIGGDLQERTTEPVPGMPKNTQNSMDRHHSLARNPCDCHRACSD
jgi:hypothetical protein